MLFAFILKLMLFDLRLFLGLVCIGGGVETSSLWCALDLRESSDADDGSKWFRSVSYTLRSSTFELFYQHWKKRRRYRTINRLGVPCSHPQDVENCVVLFRTHRLLSKQLPLIDNRDRHIDWDIDVRYEQFQNHRRSMDRFDPRWIQYQPFHGQHAPKYILFPRPVLAAEIWVSDSMWRRVRPVYSSCLCVRALRMRDPDTLICFDRRTLMVYQSCN